MRHALCAAMLFALPACAGSDASPTMRLPDWNGPALQCRHLHDGGLQIEMVVPTGGHQLALAGVSREGPVATVDVDYATPTGDLVTQVITTMTVDVPADRLGDATAVLVQVHRDGAAEPRLAVATSRPVR